MCGIVGTINVEPSANVLELIRHRGPDFQSSITDSFAR